MSTVTALQPKLPTFIEERLAEDLTLRSVVDLIVSEFAVLLNHSHIPFFPDYTDHGLQHVVGVLDTAATLIPESARTLVTPGDVAVLSIAVFLHDIAMHVTEGMFSELITGEARECHGGYFNDVPWPIAWEQFLFAAKRWNEDKLAGIFGATALNGDTVAIVNPFEHYGNLTLYDRKLIGEFIRLNHARMAHEFALWGPPGRGRNSWFLREIAGEDLTDIAGAIARSHCLPLRFSWEYVAKKYHRREYKGVHAAFVMAVIRIADFVQIQADRAPRLIFQYKRIPSPKSQLEWKAHQAVTNITQTHDDPESLDITASPEDVCVYLRLKEWLADFQAELDSSWAVLGEVYGSHAILRNLAIILRRVRSNLDGSHFASVNPVYVPDRIEFQVQRPQLLKLLVRPLYGDRPEIGVRELLQNAIDAVRERWAFQERHQFAKQAHLRQQDGDVICQLSDPDPYGYAYLEIADTGIGMTVEVIKQYFLNVGASYRTSEAWQREFEEEIDSDDSTGIARSRVLRSGRFGIGVLAAFLLGNEIEVATRFITAPTGLYFRTQLDALPVQVNYRSELKVGTVIRIRLAPSTVERLRRDADSRWDWYCFDRPAVKRIIGSKGSLLSQEYSLPDDIQAPRRGWRSLEINGYSGVLWSYQRAPAITCNGLLVKHTVDRRDYTEKLVGPDNRRFRIRRPNIIVFDPDGRYPLNLQRDRLVGMDPFAAQLWRQVLRDMLAYAIVQARAQVSPMTLQSINPYLGVELMNEREVHQWAITPGGLLVADDWCLNMLDAHSIFHLFRDVHPFCPPLGTNWPDVTLAYKADDPKLSPRNVIREVARRLPKHQFTRLPKNRQITGTRVCLTTSLYHSLLKHSARHFVTSGDSEEFYQEKLDEIRKMLVVAEKHGAWTVVSTRGCGQSLIDQRRLDRISPPSACSFAVELFSGPESQVDEDSPYIRRRKKRAAILTEAIPDRRSELEKLWVEVLAQPAVPLGIEKQTAQIAGALRELKDMISAHEFMAGNGLESAKHPR